MWVGERSAWNAVDADLGGRVQVVAGLGEERRHVTGRALARTVEERLAALERRLVDRSPPAPSAPGCESW